MLTTVHQTMKHLADAALIFFGLALAGADTDGPLLLQLAINLLGLELLAAGFLTFEKRGGRCGNTAPRKKLEHLEVQNGILRK